MKLPRYRTGEEAVDDELWAIAQRTAPDGNADLVFELLVSTVRLGLDRADRGDLKLANAALKEMRQSFHVFSPYRSARKAAIFGSARTLPDDPLYDQARDFAAAIAARDWMVITGAGPGIMEAGIDGAGPDQAFGVSIKLPFESPTGQFLADDPKLLSFRYFFTRKLQFIKESDAFVLLPGGFGTMDEAFELLTLLQTGKAQSAPVVLLDVPGGTYWSAWVEFIERELGADRYISSDDLALVRVTDSVDVAMEEVLHFYRNYHSQRFVNGKLVLRMVAGPDPATLAVWNDEFADIVPTGAIEVIDATAAERADDDHVDLPRIAFRFDRRHWARLRMLIDRCNALDPA